MLRQILTVAVVYSLLAGCGAPASIPISLVPQNAPVGSRIAPGPNSSSNELPEPPEVRSVGGVAKVNLAADLNIVSGLPELNYKMPGVTPTLRINPGDTIVVDLINNMPPGFGEQYNINLHFHGMGSSPLPPGDDVLGTFARPGQRLHYVVHVPKNQEPGLYWYHPHIHGQVNFQVGESGVSGAIIVNGLEHHLPGLAKMRERLIIVRDVGIARTLGTHDDQDGMRGMEALRPQAINSDPCGPDIGLTPTLNGVSQPNITIAPGEKQFFRVINATGHKTLKLAVDGTKLELVAIDGFALDSYPGTPPTRIESTAIVAPASRAEFVVTGPQNPLAKFRTRCYDTGVGGDRDPNLVLAVIRQSRPFGNAQRVASGPLKVGSPLPDDVYTEPLPSPSVKRVVVFSEDKKHFLINRKVFSMNDPPMFIVHTGTVEEWHIVNTSQEIHDFHIHQLHFVVKQVNGKDLEHPYWADSVIIPQRRSEGHPGTLRLLMDFRNRLIKGTFVFHCHILDHEDHGMMAKIQAI